MPMINEGQDRSLRANIQVTDLVVYSEKDLNVAEQNAAKVAGTVANAQFRQSLEREAREQEVLAKIGRVITSSSDVDEVFGLFAEQVRKLVPFDSIGIAIIDAESGMCTSAYRLGSDWPGIRAGNVFSPAGRPLEQVIKTGRRRNTAPRRTASDTDSPCARS